MDNPHQMTVEKQLSFSDLDQIRSGIAVYNQSLELVFANKRIRSYLPDLYARLDAGGTLLDAIERQLEVNFPDISADDCKERALSVQEKILNEESMEVNTPSGIRLKSTYSKTASGYYILTTTDVTDHIIYERELANARLEAERANKAKSEFLANMSHEIRTPMSGVFMAAQLLQTQLRALDHPKLSELADVLIGSSQHLSGVINDILVVSKIEAGQLELNVQLGDLADMLRLLVKSQAYVAENAGLELKLILDPNLPRSLSFDSLRVRQCVTNLLNNALKFTASGSVTLAALYDAGINLVTIHVIDTGPGIAAENQEKIFSEFGQALGANATTKVGTGLGLSISRNLANLMGGDLKLASKLGEGSAFSLTFPSASSEADDSRAIAPLSLAG